MVSRIFFAVFLAIALFCASQSSSEDANFLQFQKSPCWMCDRPHCADCVASQWTSWSQCSSPCGRNGYQRRTRLVYRPQSCSAQSTCRDLKDTEWQPCNRFCHNGGTPSRWFCTCFSNYTGDCCETVATGWSKWGAWGECSKSCATGVQERMRVCHSPLSSNSSDCDCGCPGSSIESRPCNTYDCTVEFRPLGCFKDGSPRSLPTLVKNIRSQIDWNNMTKTVVACAKLARARAFTIFGIQFYGECWSGKDAGKTYAFYGPSKNCWSGVGKVGSYYVYNLKV